MSFLPKNGVFGLLRSLWVKEGKKKNIKGTGMKLTFFLSSTLSNGYFILSCKYLSSIVTITYYYITLHLKFNAKTGKRILKTQIRVLKTRRMFLKTDNIIY